eukprot:1157111-Pelagomonas_calceolata.AAC.14
MEASPGQRGTVSRFMLDNGMRGELDRPALLIGLNLKVLEALLGKTQYDDLAELGGMSAGYLITGSKAHVQPADDPDNPSRMANGHGLDLPNDDGDRKTLVALGAGTSAEEGGAAAAGPETGSSPGDGGSGGREGGVRKAAAQGLVAVAAGRGVHEGGVRSVI